MKELLGSFLKGAGYRHVTFGTGAAALDAITPRDVGCLLIDLTLPDIPGLTLRHRLLAKGCRQPFIVVTGMQDVGIAVQALQEGAVDLLQKPVNRARLLQSIARAVDRDCRRRCAESYYEKFTARERDVLKLVAQGQATKEIARRFAISPRTVDVHRHHILKKMEMQSFAQVLRVLNGHEELVSD